MEKSPKNSQKCHKRKSLPEASPWLRGSRYQLKTVLAMPELSFFPLPPALPTAELKAERKREREREHTDADPAAPYLQGQAS